MVSNAIDRVKQFKLQNNREAILIIILAIIAFALRYYSISQKPLWLDEIYGYQLGKVGFIRLIQNSLYDPNPPLYYLLQWAATGFDIWQSEWAMRWLSVITGWLTVLFTYKLGRHYADSVSAFLGALLLAISPYHVFYSQEARSAALITLLSAATMYILYKLLATPDNKHLWILFGLFSLGGLYASYSFVLITSIQILYLFFALKHRYYVILYATLLIIFCAPLAYLFWRSIPTVAAQHAQSSTRAWEFIQALLGGEPVRFGFYWGHTWGAVAYGILILPGLWWQKKNKSFRYYILQVLLPFILFWSVFVFLLGLRLPLSEAKQFIVILPAFFVLVCAGIAGWQQLFPSILGKGGLFTLYSLILFVSILSLSRYWRTPKSPEGHAIRALAQQMEANDAVVSLHHSLNASLSFYSPNTSTFTSPIFQDGQYVFSQNTLIILGPKQIERNVPYADIVQASRIWLLTDTRKPTDVEEFFLSHCRMASSQEFAPFQIRLLTDCSESQN